MRNWTSEDINLIRNSLDCEYNSEDFARFNTNVETIKDLIAKGLCDPSECQNDSPSISEFVKFAEKHPGFNLIGFVIFPPRNDIGITLEAVHFEGEISTDLVIDAHKFSLGSEETEITKNSIYIFWD